MKGVRKKGYFGRHAKSSAAMVSLIIHAVVLVAAISFVAVRVAVKEDVIFEPKPVQRPRVQLQKLRLPVEMKKKVPPPKLRQRLVTQTKIKPTQLVMPEVTGVSGGTGFLDGDGGLGGFDFKGLKVSFFGVQGGGNRLVFIIDYSWSMRGVGKEDIMRREAARVIEELPSNVEFAVILFNGPAWPADQDLSSSAGKWVWTNGDFNSHRPRDWNDLPQVRFKRASNSAKRAMIRRIEETPLMGGTVYDNPLFMALRMDPMPDTIFFMTDGGCDPKRGIIALREMIRQLQEAGKKIPQIHTVGFGIDKNSQLEEMARLTNGECRFIQPSQYIAKYGPNTKRMKEVEADPSVEEMIRPVGADEYPVSFRLN